MERETRNKKRTDQNRIATGDFARVLRRRSPVRSLVVVIFAGAVLSSVGCNFGRSMGRVDSPRGEYFLEARDAEEIWRSAESEDSSKDLNIRGRERETYEIPLDVDVEGKRTNASFSDRFKHMFRKSDHSPSVTDSRSKENPKIASSSNYFKNDASFPESHVSLSGRSERPEVPKESFWSKIFGTSHSVETDEIALKKPNETRAGGLAYDGANGVSFQNAPKERSPQQVYVRKRWTSRQAPREEANVSINPLINPNLGAVAKPRNDAKSAVVAKPQNNAKPSGVAKPRNNAKSAVVAKPQNNAKTAVVAEIRNDSGVLLIRQYDSQRFLPPFRIIEQYYYPSGAVPETTSESESNLSCAKPIKTFINADDARGRYSSSVYAPIESSTVDSSVSQVTYYGSPNLDSAYAKTDFSQVQNSNAEEAQTQKTEPLERRREFAWFDDAPSSLTPDEQAECSLANSSLEESESATMTDSSERYESETTGRRSADEILDESARREKEAYRLDASKSVSYEEPTNESNVLSDASTIDDVLGATSAISVLDVSSFIEQTDALNGAVVAINSIDERKSENAQTPLTNEEIEWVKHVEEAIQGLLTERAELKKRGEDARVCDARLRLLFLVVGEYDRQVQAIDDATDPLKIFWEKECDGLEELLQNKLEEIDPVFVAETLMSGLDSFFDICDVQIRKALLVDAPACFGLYEERVKPYRPGEVVYAYAELDYVVSKKSSRGHEIAVECRWRLLDSNGNALTNFQTQRCENVAETRLRDVVLNVAVPLSNEIAPNDYLLEIEVVDLNAPESVSTKRRLRVKVVPNSESDVRG